jgi:hypothetical protein
MYLSLGIGLIISALSWNHNVAQASKIGGAYFVLYILIFVAASFVLLIWLVARRHKNWARWILLVLSVSGIPSEIGVIRHLFSFAPVAGVLSLVQNSVQAIALVSVFTGNARDWFKGTPTPVEG